MRLFHGRALRKQTSKIKQWALSVTMESSAKCTLYDLDWDPRLRRQIHAMAEQSTVHHLRDELYAVGITTLQQAQAQLNTESPCLLGLKQAERDEFLHRVAQADASGKASIRLRASRSWLTTAILTDDSAAPFRVFCASQAI